MQPRAVFSPIITYGTINGITQLDPTALLQHRKVAADLAFDTNCHDLLCRTASALAYRSLPEPNRRYLSKSLIGELK